MFYARFQLVVFCHQANNVNTQRPEFRIFTQSLCFTSLSDVRDQYCIDVLNFFKDFQIRAVDEVKFLVASINGISSNSSIIQNCNFSKYFNTTTMPSI